MRSVVGTCFPFLSSRKPQREALSITSPLRGMAGREHSESLNTLKSFSVLAPRRISTTTTPQVTASSLSRIFLTLALIFGEPEGRRYSIQTELSMRYIPFSPFEQLIEGVGKLHFALRNYTDEADVTTMGTTVAEILDAYRPRMQLVKEPVVKPVVEEKPRKRAFEVQTIRGTSVGSQAF